jgi:hypothetical protein
LEGNQSSKAKEKRRKKQIWVLLRWTSSKFLRSFCFCFHF